MRIYLSDGKTQTQHFCNSDAQIRTFSEGTVGVLAVYTDGDGYPKGNIILEFSPEDALLLAARVVNHVAHLPKEEK